MIRYATERYGEERVAQIVTYGTIKAKAALKDAARVLGHPFSVAERLTKAMPPAVMGKDIPLKGIVDPGHERYGEAAEIRSLVESDPTFGKVFSTARGLEGLIRQPGVHAAGVILSSEPLLDVQSPASRREATAQSTSRSAISASSQQPNRGRGTSIPSPMDRSSMHRPRRSQPTTPPFLLVSRLPRFGRTTCISFSRPAAAMVR